MTPTQFQALLNARGFDAGPADGFWGPWTEKAVAAWFRSGHDLDTPPEAMQVTSAAGVAFLHGWESCRLTAYRDSKGVLTIGWGHTSAAGAPTVKAGMTITQAEADDIFRRDLAKFETRVRKEMGPVPQSVFDMAVSFDYNTGAIDTASWVDAYLGGVPKEAERRLKLWNKSGGSVVRGLTKRRAAEADMGFRGNYAGRP